ncbi:hypothetical protein CFC21_082149 [Triticum aestivum]|uniref:Uncharacterized protein n=3 Tax=Triticum TaxID=4564 RepID=A0A9R1I5T8_WHEAT|nr:hypothetical protein CFC21_082149 [Triticum aestivum]
MPTNWWQKWSFLLRKGRKGFTNKTRPSIQKIYKVLALNFRIPRSDVSALFQLSNMQSLWYAALSPPPATLSRPTASLETGAYPYPDSISASPSSLIFAHARMCPSVDFCSCVEAGLCLYVHFCSCKNFLFAHCIMLLSCVARHLPKILFFHLGKL